MMEKKTIKELVLETIEYYENYPERRAKGSTGTCLYYHNSSGNMCAVGRCMKDPNQDYDNSIFALKKGKDEISKENLWKEMREEYSEIPFEVWESLQCFHDSDYFWDSVGLTKMGLNYKRQLLDNFCL
jgi:hypothetical protein